MANPFTSKLHALAASREDRVVSYLNEDQANPLTQSFQSWCDHARVNVSASRWKTRGRHWLTFLVLRYTGARLGDCRTTFLHGKFVPIVTLPRLENRRCEEASFPINIVQNRLSPIHLLTHSPPPLFFFFRLCLERLIPRKKELPIDFHLAALHDVSDIRELFSSVAAALDEGGITPTEARVLVDMAEAFKKLLEVTELETRVSALEKRAAR